MATRQSLKDLQVRLAQRLSAAKTESATASWLAVQCGERHFLLPLVQSGEIFSWTSVQSVPYTKPWYLGVASLRGGLQGVIDLGQLVGQVDPLALVPLSERVTSESRLVSLHNALGVNAVLWVDRLLGLRNPAMFQTVDERQSEEPDWFGRRLSDREGRPWQELDMQKLSGDADFLAIAA
jgi:twitching motility protein PilI